MTRLALVATADRLAMNVRMHNIILQPTSTEYLTYHRKRFCCRDQRGGKTAYTQPDAREIALIAA